MSVGRSGDKDFYKMQKFKNERVLSRSAFSFKLLMLFLVSYTRWRSLDRVRILLLIQSISARRRRSFANNCRFELAGRFLKVRSLERPRLRIFKAQVREGEDLLQITADLRVKVSRCEAWNE